MHIAEKEAASGYHFSRDSVARYINIDTRPPQTCPINESLGLLLQVEFGLVSFSPQNMYVVFEELCGAPTLWNDS